MKFDKTIVVLSTAFILLLISHVSFGQAPPSGGPGSGNGPVDGGVITLLAGAAAYGYKKLQNKEN